MTDALSSYSDAAFLAGASLRKIAIEAGRRIMDIYAGDFQVAEKEDASPLTEADMASHHTIISGLALLKGLLGEIPVMSEEGDIADWSQRRDWTAWWLIDPLDGTKEFVKRNGEFTVNIALMVRAGNGHTAVPLAGWVYAPVPDILYEGILGKGAVRISEAGNVTPGNSETLPAEPALSPPRLVASRSHRSKETDIIINAVAEAFGAGEIVSSGSSLKICRVAEGSAELYPRAAPTMEWDTAAADAVCRAAGVRVVQADSGANLEYGKENLLNPWFLVSGDSGILDVSVSSLT